VSSPLPVYRDRPQWLPCPDTPGLRVCIAAHDQEYLRLKSEWKRKAADAHPDRTGRAFAFRQIQKQRERWEADEQAWYAKHGLTPPDPPRPLVAGPSALLLRAAAHRVPSNGDRVRAYVAANPTATDHKIAAALGVTVNLVRVAVRRKPKTPRASTYAQALAALLSDGRSHTLTECRAVASRHVGVTVWRLRGRGFDVVYERRGRVGTYRLVAPPSHLQELQ
jgi:hypothetical protein